MVGRRFHRPPYLFLLISLFILWLPGVLFVPAGHALHTSGVVPFFFVISAMGLLALGRMFARWVARNSATVWTKAGALLAVVLVSGGLTTHYYFARWESQPSLYEAFDNHLVDTSRLIIDRSGEFDVLLPAGMYFHPTTRFFLHGVFRQSADPPATAPDRGALLVTEPQYHSMAYVWLGQGEDGEKVAYMGHPLLGTNPSSLSHVGNPTSFLNPLDESPLVTIIPLESLEPVRSSLTDWRSLKPVDYEWDHQVELMGYEVFPQWVQPGQSPVLILYWRSLVDQPFEGWLFIQLVNGQGEPIAQWVEGSPTRHLRWQTGILDPDEHILWIGPEADPGPYLVRVGMFDPALARRIPAYRDDEGLPGDQVLVGLFYVAEEESDPRLPETPLLARLGDQIELMGYSLPTATDPRSEFKERLHWRANDSIDEDYTTFVQFLDTQGQLVTSWDSQPLVGQYPTSHWQPGEIVVDEFTVPLPTDLRAGDYQLVTGMYNLVSGERLPVAGPGGQRLPGDMIRLLQAALPE